MSLFDASLYGRKVEKLEASFSGYNENYIDAPFYTNHDTGRGAGYYSGEYSPAQTKIAMAMNLFMSGASFTYYGEELGMKGTGRDENKRAPMQWSSNPDAEGMCDGPEAMEEITMKYGSLEEQQDDPDSIYNYYKKAIRYKNMYPEIARGRVKFIEDISSEDICVLRKQWEDESIVIIYNISQNENEVDLTGLLLEEPKLKVCGTLLTQEGEPKMEGEHITLSPYSVVLLKQ